jgi:PAS domain S-box-containing protein/putative nucleotidyltransferase with HDIG domain
MTHASHYSVLDNLLEGCQVISFEYRYLYVNEAVAKQGRRSREELVGHTMMELYPGIETTQMFSLLIECMSERKPAELENEFTFPDGSVGWFALKIEPVPEGAFILSIDISERKRAEIELQNQLGRIQALREIDLAIISTTNLSFSLRTILEKVTSSLSVDAADILLLNPNTQILEFAAGRGFQTHGMEQMQRPVGQGYAGRAALEQRTVFIPDLREAQEPLHRTAAIAEEKFVSFYCVPLIIKGRVVGELEVFHRSALEPDRTWLEFLYALAGQASIAIDSSHLFHDLQRRNIDLILAYDSTIEGWSRALDLRDKETEGHTLRVTEMTIALARAAGIPEEEMIHVKRGALLHDIGKMGVPDRILHKPGRLTEAEWEIMHQHPAYARDMLYPIEYLRPALSIPYSHHERWDGSGYPQGLKAEQIPLPARLFAIVDVWDALRSNRPYRQGWPEEDVLKYIRSEAGAHFDPQAVDLFLRVVNEQAPATG